MTMFARSDLSSITLANGCGVTHERPFVPTFGDGHEIRVKIWELNCARCEAELVGDDGWAKNEMTIPLTPDETLEAEAAEKHGNALVKQVANAMAESATAAVREMGSAVRA